MSTRRSFILTNSSLLLSIISANISSVVLSSSTSFAHCSAIMFPNQSLSLIQYTSFSISKISSLSLLIDADTFCSHTNFSSFIGCEPLMFSCLFKCFIQYSSISLLVKLNVSFQGLFKSMFR